MQEVTKAGIVVNNAAQEWNKAPSHIKAMAGQWMRPVLQAMLAQQAALEAICLEVKHGKA